MLAQNFKSAAELDLTSEIYEGLKKVLVLLETGYLVHYAPHIEDFNKFWESMEGNVKANSFSMRLLCHSTQCGTVGCIAGWTAVEANMKGFGSLLDLAEKNRQLHNLFYPPDHYVYGLITPEQAASALRHYLTTGITDWAMVLGPNNC